VVFKVKILILYISFSERTKLLAEFIAKNLKSHKVNTEQLKYSKKARELFKEKDLIKKGDLSGIIYNENVEDLGNYDLVFFGTPNHGGQPCIIFDGFMERAQNVAGKKFILFATARLTTGKVFSKMKSVIEKKGGKIIGQKLLKKLLKIKTSKINKFIEELNQELVEFNLFQ